MEFAMSPKTILLGSALMLLAACGSNDQPLATDNGTGNGVGAASENVGANDVAAAPAAAEFVSKVAASDLFEIESGKLAAEKATSADVKSFAKMLVTDHSKSTADLKAAAGKATPPISVNPALDAEKQAMLDLLKSTAAADFDRVFLDQQKQAHQKALDLLRQYESSGDTPALKEFATKASTVVQGHLDKIDGLKR
jgi:putative membrane protein